VVKTFYVDAEAEDRLVKKIVEAADCDYRDQGGLPESAINRGENDEDKVKEANRAEVLPQPERDPGTKADSHQGKQAWQKGRGTGWC